MNARIAAADWPRLLDLVEQALDVPDLERELWLRRLHLPPALAASARRLLQERQVLEGDDFLGRGLPSFIDPGGASRGGYGPGALLGPWRLLRPLGQGGMSVVWLAERADGQIERQVALKLPHAGPGQDVLARRLLRERKILAALAHPHIARLYDVGLADDGTPYLVMEVVPGTNLLDYADVRRLDLRQRAALFQQVLSAVQYAHAQLVLHRDLKPSNMLVTDDGEVKLLDFGIAKALYPPGGDHAHTEPTRADARHMTPGYASPEQLAGDSLSTASDVYSLGVVFYELMCGRRPREPGGPPVEARPPSRQPLDADQAGCRGGTPRALARQLRGDLDAIALHALAPRPAQRYASVDAFAADLDRWRRGQAVLARAPGWGYTVGKFINRHRVAVAIGALASALLLTASTAAFVQGRVARQEASRAAAARDFLLRLFADAAPDRNGGNQPSAVQVLARGREAALADLQQQPLLRAEVLVGIGQTQMQMREMDSAVATLDEAAGLFASLGRTTDEASARLLALEAVSVEERVDELSRRFLELRPLTTDIQADPVLKLRWLMAKSWHDGYGRQDADAGRAALEQLVALADPGQPAQAQVAFRAHLLLAMYTSERGLGAQSQAHLDAAAALPGDDRLNPPAEMRVALDYTRAQVQVIQRDLVRPMDWLPGAIDHCTRGFGSDSPRCVELRRMQLWCLMRMGLSQQAMAQVSTLHRVLATSRDRSLLFHTAYLAVRVLASAGLDDGGLPPVKVLKRLLLNESGNSLRPNLSIPGHAALALMHLHAGELGRAQMWLDFAQPIVEGLKPGEFPEQLRMLRLVQGLMAQARGEHAHALELMGSFCAATPTEPLQPALPGLDCVRSLVATGQHAQALQLVRQVLPVLERSLGGDAPHVLRARLLLHMLQTPGGYRPGAWDGSLVFFS